MRRLRIDNEVAKHGLCIDLVVKKVQQKMRTFSTEKYTAIVEEMAAFKQ